MLEIENDKNMFIENENKELLCSLPAKKTPSLRFI
jgi:hypothetical protein